MDFNLDKSIEILARTPETLRNLLDNISADWTSVNEGGETWSVYDIIGHLIHGEKTDWIVRTAIILSDRDNKSFELFDRFAQFDQSNGKSLQELLEEFKLLRKNNIHWLRAQHFTNTDLQRIGIHPAFGAVTLSQLLATWTVHDLNHISQICRVMAKQYKDEVGPWTAYLRILQS